jgi:hypothetical protein
LFDTLAELPPATSARIADAAGLNDVGLGTVWGHQLATSMLADAGFPDVTVHEIETDPFNNYYIARKK